MQSGYVLGLNDTRFVLKNTEVDVIFLLIALFRKYFCIVTSICQKVPSLLLFLSLEPCVLGSDSREVPFSFTCHWRSICSASSPPRPPQISSSYHKKTVYTLAWGPPVPPVSFGKFLMNSELLLLFALKVLTRQRKQQVSLKAQTSPHVFL